MNNEVKKFPEFFPNLCPPKEAKEENILVYRLTKNSPATEKDFLSHVLLYPNKKYTDIKAYGLSVFEDYNEIKNALNLNPRLRKFKYISYGNTFEYTGVILRTSNERSNYKSHITWWLYKNIYPHTYFNIRKDGEKSE
ncbi:hypothetical protein J2Z42_001390 [Clostridium algifaecis]|uniref:Uncharacterized protein n=1 Tax=Clostridium algifaecis TaxID=1472040 RepID=A0ABS4KRQ3_9CLOT|nr:DUF4168 domain-containing protein [Clostridium algifaecis]MBP2032716.1 hypothetical protein [Clostridium algifaecis]